MVSALLVSLTQQFAIDCNNKPSFFGLHPWYQYLKLDEVTSNGTVVGCTVNNFQVLGKDSGLLLVGLAILDDLVRVAALVAVGFIIYGGITYAASQGSPDQTGKAQNTIINALIGLVVALIATGVVNFIGNRLGA